MQIKTLQDQVSSLKRDKSKIELNNSMRSDQLEKYRIEQMKSDIAEVYHTSSYHHISY